MISAHQFLALIWFTLFVTEVFSFETLQFFSYFLGRTSSYLHGKTQFSIMHGTVHVSDISHIALESFLADIAIKHFSSLAFLIFLDAPDVLFDVQALLSANQETLVAANLN